MQPEDEGAEYYLSYQDLHFWGTLQRKQAQRPYYLYQCPLIEQMTNYIERTFNVQFIRPDAVMPLPWRLEQIPATSAVHTGVE